MWFLKIGLCREHSEFHILKTNKYRNTKFHTEYHINVYIMFRVFVEDRKKTGVRGTGNEYLKNSTNDFLQTGCIVKTFLLVF